MSDMDRSGSGESTRSIALRDAHLRKKQLEIDLWEKVQQYKGVVNQIERIKQIELRKHEIKAELLLRDINDIKRELGEKAIKVDVVE